MTDMSRTISPPALSGRMGRAHGDLTLAMRVV